ncbi:MAG: LPS export ABC transporter periplasmic protein LptC [Castellaniella sp.]
MRERGPTLIAVTLLMALVAGTWWAADYVQRAVPIDPPARLTHEPDSWAGRFVMIRTGPDGVAINRLEGLAMRHYPDDDSYEVDHARATGQHADAPVTISRADHATMDAEGTRIVMQGNARVHRLPDLERAELDVQSERLVLYPDEDVVETDLPATVVNGPHVMYGIGMRYDNRSRTLQVFSATDVKISGQETVPRPKIPG